MISTTHEAAWVSATGLTSATSQTFDITQAPTAFWTNPSGGNWSDGANWSTGVAPGASDTASITLDGTYTVTLDESRTGVRKMV